MPKLLWVLLPLAATALWLALRAWRGRWPSRPSLNVLFSLLLLGYVGGTAGLGLFWVANQQLPVFDWHYLFGYATVLMVVVHLAFNGRIVWQHLRRAVLAARRGGGKAEARAESGAGAADRRPLLGAVGMGGVAALAAAAGLGYLVGLRHGRTELRLADAGEAAPPQRAGPAERAGSPSSGSGLATGRAAAEAWAVVERFHAFSAHSRTRVLRHAAGTGWGGSPPPFKRFPGASGGRDRLPLPAPATASRRGDSGRAPDLAALATWLWHTAGISERRGGIAFRASPSSGALFATELYVLALHGLHGLEPGTWWHYDPEAHALQRVPVAAAAPAMSAALAALDPLALPARCHAVTVASAIFARSGHKYGDRTFRYVLADLGHALENLLRATAAHGGVQATLLPRFDDEALARALALDVRLEGVLAAVALAPPGPAAGGATDGRWISAWQAHAGAAPGSEPARLELTEAMQAATSLRAVPPASPEVPPTLPAAPTEGLASAAAAARAPDRPSPATHALPAARALAIDPLPLIARRRSLRRFSAEPLSQQALADILHAMTAPAPRLSPAVRIDVLTTAVAGLSPASWRVHHGDGHVRAEAPLSPSPSTSPSSSASPLELQLRVRHDANARRRARAAALDQDVLGDAAAVFVLSLSRAALRADPAGAARGYRHGFIEAGLVGERIYLAAGALGLGVCAVGAFYDDEAAALVGLDAAHEWPVHFAALGVPG